MKINIALVITLSFWLMLSTSCEKPEEIVPQGCDENPVNLGAVSLDPETIKMVPDPDLTTSLVFENNSGATIELEQTSRTEEDFHLEMEVLCSHSYDNKIYTYYDAKRYWEIYEDGNGGIVKFARYVRAARGYLPDEVLYDHLFVTACFNETSFGFLTMRSSLRGAGDSFPQDLCGEGSTANRYIESIELGGNTYNDVYVSTGSGCAGAAIYVSKEEGLIGLIDSRKNEFWKLKKDEEN